MTTALLKEVPPLSMSSCVGVGKAPLFDVFFGDEHAPRQMIINTNKKKLTVFIKYVQGENELLSGKINRSILKERLLRH